MTIVAWLILGACAGWIANRLVYGGNGSVLLDVILGIVGAAVGGWLFQLIGARGIGGFDLYSLFVAVVGALVTLIVYHALRRRA